MLTRNEASLKPLKLPSRYEDLDIAFRGRLRPDPHLLAIIKAAYQSMQISGGIRFLPVFGKSGSGKTSSASEIGTHLPEARVINLSRDAVESFQALENVLAREILHKRPNEFIVALVDQYEEASAQRTAIPTSFVEALSLLDRGPLRQQHILFIWLTTSKDFKHQLASATSRNARILVSSDFEVAGPDRETWPSIIEETFRFHNQDRSLADYEIITENLRELSLSSDTIGAAILNTGARLAKYAGDLQDLSTYQVVVLWPVTDGLRITS